MVPFLRKISGLNPGVENRDVEMSCWKGRLEKRIVKEDEHSHPYPSVKMATLCLVMAGAAEGLPSLPGSWFAPQPLLKLGMQVHAYNPSTWGDSGRRIGISRSS